MKSLVPSAPMPLVAWRSSISIFFKKINDQFGHATGDEALRTFSISLFANLRNTDKLGRYGGEEFLLIMPETSKDRAVRTLDRLRSIISGLDWSAISGSMNVTMSVGMCAVRREDWPRTFLLGPTWHCIERKAPAVIE